MANTSSKSMDQDFNDVYFPSLEEFQAQTEPTAKTTLFDADSAQSPFANPFETVALTLSTESSESSSATRRLPMFQLQRGDSNVSETPISHCDDDDAVISVKKRRLDSSPVAIATTISWVDASSLGGDDYADEDDDSHNDSSFQDAVDDANDDANDDDLTADDSAIPADLITRSKTRRGKIPRLVKHDIRRYYGRMLYNVMNSHDRQLIMQWFQTFAVHSMKLYRLEDLGPLVYAEHHRNESQLIAGRNSIVSYLLQVQRRIPDLVTRLNDHYQVLRWKDRRSSQIVFQATFTGSTFEYYPEESAQVEHVREATPPPSMQPITPADATCPQQLLNALPDEFDRQTLLLNTAVNLPTPPVSQQTGPATPTIVGMTQPLRRVSHIVRFQFQLETTLHLNDEMLLYRWESKTLQSDTKRVSVSDL